MLVTLLAAAPQPAPAQGVPLPAGLPPIHLIEPDPEVFPRFYTVTQAPDGAVHVGGAEGIYSHDGRRWQFMPMPNGSLVRSLHHDGSERLYVGGYGQFGYAVRTTEGQLRFHDLTPAAEELPGDNVLADIWEILPAPEGVYFRGVHHLFLFDPVSNRIRSWYHAGRLGVMVRHQDQTLIQFRGTGIKTFNGQDFELVPGGELLTVQVYALLPLPDGGLLTLARDGLWQRFDRGTLREWPAPESLPGSDAFSAWLVLPDGSLALSTPDGQLHLLNPSSGSHRRFQVANAYITDLAHSIQGGLLAQTDLGTLYIAWPSQWTRIGIETGLRGRVMKVVPWQNGWRVVTNAGVHAARTVAPDKVMFQRTDLTSAEAWDWIETEDGIGLLAESYGLVEVRGETHERLSEDALYPRLFVPSPSDATRLHVGTELGIALFVQRDGRWQRQFSQTDYTGRVTAIIELDTHRLLLAIDDAGVVEIRYAPDYSDLEEWRAYDTGDGIHYGSGKSAFLTRLDDGHIIASTSEGLFSWQGGAFEATDLAGLADLRHPQGLYKLSVAPDGSWWAHSHDHLLRRQPGHDWQVEDVSALQPGMIASLSFTDNGLVQVGGIATVLQFDPSVEPLQKSPTDVVIRTVRLTHADGSEQYLPLDGSEPRIPHDFTNLVFEYALPDYHRPELTRYQARLAGYEEQYSDWGLTTRITYSNLRPGNFSFIARARDSQGRISHTRPFEFRVLPPWYFTLGAKILWVVLFLALMAMITVSMVRWRVARVNEDRERLGRKVAERTAELAAANRRLRNIANVDGLTSVANRRRLEEYLPEAWSSCRDRDCELSIILLDVDHFKAYNDTHGHQAGDDALREVAGILANSLRRSEDVVARYGGEEFICVLPGAGREMAWAVAETMREKVAQSVSQVTVSVGVATGRPSAHSDSKDLIGRADQALYKAKQAGRNQARQASDH